jgi:hypothetical protein
MSDTPSSGELGAPRRRPVRRTAAAPALLPSARAALGALLCALAALLTFTAYRNANRPPTTTYLVATRPLAPGQVLTAADLEPVALDVPVEFRTRLFTDPGRLRGVNVIGPVEKGELLQLGNLILKGDPTRDEFSFTIDAPDAANGRIQPGERIRIYNRTDAGAERLGDTTVVAIERFDSGAMVYTVIPDPSLDAEALIAATANGKLYVVRTTGSDPSGRTTAVADAGGDPAAAGTGTGATGSGAAGTGTGAAGAGAASGDSRAVAGAASGAGVEETVRP